MHPYFKNFLESKKRLERDNVTCDLETENHLISYLLQNQKLPGKYRNRDFNPSYNLQDSMDLLEYVYPEYYIEITSSKDNHKVQFYANRIGSNNYITKESKWLSKSIFMAIIQDFHDTYEWENLEK